MFCSKQLNNDNHCTAGPPEDVAKPGPGWSAAAFSSLIWTLMEFQNNNNYKS